jgi:hypothetical protein
MVRKRALSMRRSLLERVPLTGQNFVEKKARHNNVRRRRFVRRRRENF